MAIFTDFTGLKGNTIRVIPNGVTAGTNPGDDTTITLGEYLRDGLLEVTAPAGTCQITGEADQNTSENNCGDLNGTWTAGTGTVHATRTVLVQGGKRGTEVTTGDGAPDDTNGVQGDIYLDTGTDQIYVKDSDSAWGAADSDFTGTRGASIANVTGTSTAVQFVDSDGVDVGSALDLKGDAGSGFNAYDTTGNTTYAIGDTVISNNADDTPVPTHWRALTGSTDVTPVEGVNWSELITKSQDSGGTTRFPTTDATTDVAGYVTVTLDDNPTPIPGGFPGLRLNLSSDGTTYNKFNSTTPIARVRPLLLFTTASGLDITSSGFQSLTNDDTRYQFFRFDNSAGLTAAEIATDIAAEITAGQDCSLANNLVDNNGETWNLDVTANGDMIELRATGGDNLSSEFLEVNGVIGWVGSNVDPVATGDFLEVTADNPFNIGDFVVDNSIVYVCKEAYTTATTDSRPVGDATHWKDISS